MRCSFTGTIDACDNRRRRWSFQKGSTADRAWDALQGGTSTQRGLSADIAPFGGSINSGRRECGDEGAQRDVSRLIPAGEFEAEGVEFRIACPVLELEAKNIAEARGLSDFKDDRSSVVD